MLYRSPAIPTPPRGLDPASSPTAGDEPFCRLFDGVRVRRTGPIEPDLSPARMLIDLFRLEGVTPASRHDGRRLVAAGPPNAIHEPGRSTPAIRFVLIGHFLTADFGRRFGRHFYDDLLEARPDGEGPLVLSGG